MTDDDFMIDISQKGVDIASVALKGQANRIVLIAVMLTLCLHQNWQGVKGLILF